MAVGIGALANPGRFDRRITIQSAEISRSAIGDPTESWSDVLSSYAIYDPEVGSETDRQASAQAQQTATFVLRNRPTVDASHRVIFDGRIWEIISPPFVFGQRTRPFMYLRCRDTGRRYTPVIPGGILILDTGNSITLDDSTTLTL